MNYRYLIYLPWLALLAVLDFSFVSALPQPLSFLSLSLAALVVVVELDDYPKIIFWAFASGLFLDLLHYQTFGLFLLSFLAGSTAAKFMINAFLSDRSYYSFLAVNLMLLSILYFFGLISGFLLVLFDNPGSVAPSPGFSSFLASLAVNSVIILIVYYFLSLTTKKLNPAFIRKKVQ